MAPSLTGHIASEDASVEQSALALLQELGWSPLNLMNEAPGPANPKGRTSFKQVWLPARLRVAPPEALTLAEAELTRHRSAMLPLAANREVHGHLRNGVAVEIKRPVMDWLNPAANDFVIASQVWIDGPLHRRRPDTIGYVNGLPLLEKLEGLLDAVDWTAGQQTRGAVESAIRLKLNELPEDPYPDAVWQTKVGAVWDFVLRRYGGVGATKARRPIRRHGLGFANDPFDAGAILEPHGLCEADHRYA